MQIHPQFRLNGQQFNSTEELLLFAKSLGNEVHQFLINWLDDSKYIAVKTSGSTGIPKEIQLKKEQMINSAIATGAYFNLTENTTALLCMSTQYIAGKMMLVRAMVLGWDLTIVSPISNPLKNLPKNFDFCAMVPMQVAASINELHKLKTLIVGGGAIPASLKSELQNIATNVFATYGMTETITHIAVQKLNNFKNIIAITPRREKQSNYQTLPNSTISVDNRGCLVIKAPLLADEIVVTNDLVELISETEFRWLGRIDNLINSGGVKLHPEIIEEKLGEIIKNRFFIAAEPDELLGEKVVLIIESVKYTASELSQLKSTFKEILTAYESPKSIYFVDKLVETVTKKVNRLETLKLKSNN